MNDEHKRRARAAEIRREVQKRRAARATGVNGKKIAEDSFEQVKVKMEKLKPGTNLMKIRLRKIMIN